MRATTEKRGRVRATSVVMALVVKRVALLRVLREANLCTLSVCPVFTLRRSERCPEMGLRPLERPG